MRAFAAAFAVIAFLASCGEPEPSPPTRVLIIWDSVDVEQLHACGAKHDTTPVLSALAREGWVFAPQSQYASSTAEVANVLDCLGVRSIREPGRDRIESRYGSRAEDRPSSSQWITLGSVSQAHFDYAGLGLGFQVWHAPESETMGQPLPAEQVFGAVRGEFEAALEKDAAVHLFLHFGDLRGRDWIDRGDPTPWLETFLDPWRGRGGIVDEGFARPAEGGERARTLKNTLLRRRGDERRVAMLEALYAAELSRLDAVLGQVFDVLRRAGRFETAKIEVIGLPAATPDDARAREGPGPQVLMPWIRSWGKPGRWVTVPRNWWESGLGGQAADRDDPPGGWTSSVGVGGGRSGRSFVQELATGVMRRHRPNAQRVSVSFRGEQGEVLNLRAICAETEFDLLTPDTDPEVVLLEQLGDRPPNANNRRFELPASQTLGIVPNLRGVDLALALAREGLDETDLSIAGKPLLETDLPVLLARRSPLWSQDAEEPALDLRPKSSRELELVVPGPAGAGVELVVESFPPEGAPDQPVSGNGIEVEAHAFRWGATLVRGQAPLTAVIPRRPSSTRLGIVLFLDGERVPAARMRYDDRCFRSPDELELGFGAAIWVDPAYRGAPRTEGTETVAIELHDPVPPRDDYTPPTPAERALLERLDENE